MKKRSRRQAKGMNHKQFLMRSARAAAETRYGPGGMPKPETGRNANRPITLPKMPWEEKP